MTARERAKLRWEAMRRLRRDGVRPVLTPGDASPGPTPSDFRAGVLSVCGAEILARLLPHLNDKETRR